MAAPFPERLEWKKDGKPASGEAELLRKLDDLEEEGQRVREKWAPEKDVERDLQLIRSGGGPDKKYFAANFIEAFIDRMVAQLTDNRPILRIESRKVGLKEAARALQRAITTLWEDADMQRRTYKMAHLAASMRSSGLYLGYDPIEDDVMIETLRLDQVVVDPKVTEAARAAKDADYLFVKRIVSLEELRVRFPGRGGAAKPDARLSNLRPQPAPGQAVRSPIFDAMPGRSQPSTALDRTEVVECWVRDWRRTASGLWMFPGGRLIVRVKDLVLWDGPNPYWHGRWPVEWYDWGVDPQHPWGRSEPDRLRNLQLPFNQLMDGLVRNQLLTNIFTIVADFDAFPPEVWKRLQNIEDSLILRTQRRNASVVPTPPPAFGADKLNITRQIFTMAQMLTGVTDVTLGETPGSLQSGAAIEGLQEGANLMTRSRASRLEDFYERVGQKLIALVFQFYTTDRVAGMLGPTKDAEAFGQARQELFFEKGGDGKLTATTPENRRRALKDFRFAVSPGSSAPGSRQARAALMLQLHAAGLASGEDVLAAGDFPEPREMMERASAEMALRAQAGIPPPQAPRRNQR